MATSQFTSPIDSDTDVNFRAWGSQISTQLAAVGLTQTADTGQINWTTATIVSSYSSTVAAGYEIWRFNDAAQSTTPIFLKIEYGAAAATSPYLWITVGSGSDGAGTITGTLASNRQTVNVVSTTLGNAYPSWLCYNPALGFLGLALKLGTSNAPQWGLGFMVNRTADTAGTPTTDGFNAFIGVGLGQNISVHMENPGQAVRLPSDGSFGFLNSSSWPLLLASSYAGGDTQALPFLQLQPAIQASGNMCTVIRSEVPVGTTFSLNILGLTPRTFVSVGQCVGNPTAGSNTSLYSLAMLYQ